MTKKHAPLLPGAESEGKKQKPVKDLWKKTNTPGLRIYIPTGEFYAYFKACGRPVKRRLDTNVRSTAELRLRDLKTQQRGRSDVQRKREMNFADALEEYRHTIQSSVETKDSSKFYREQTIAALLKSWPGLESTNVRKISERSCKDWASKFSDAYSPSRFNNTLGTLRAVIQIGVDKGYCSVNPAMKVGKVRIRETPLTLPEGGQFQKFIRAIRNGHGRHSRNAADLAEFLAYSGCRKEEAARVTWRHVNFKKQELTILGDPITGTKNWSYRTNPMIPDLIELLSRLHAERTEDNQDQPVCAVRECQNSMNRAAKLVKIERLTHHDLRDLFATQCIESGVPVPTVSGWLGHSDGGALAMKKYVKPRIGSGKTAAATVSFKAG